MASKSSIQKLQDLQDLVVGTVKVVAHDPVGSAGKAVHQARTFAGQVTRSATHRAVRTTSSVAAFVPSPRPAAEPPAPAVDKTAADKAAAETPAEVTPADVARVVERKSPAEKAAVRTAPPKAPAKKAPAKKASSPSAKLPPRAKA